MSQAHTCSIVVPIYNGYDCLPDLISALEAVLPSVCPQFEVILVNDGSPDRSWERICELGQARPWIRGVNLMRNYGQHNATLCGMRQARYEITITMDEDLQHPPHEIPKLLAKLDEGYDVVYGLPNKMPHSLWRNLFSFFSKRVLGYVMGVKTIRDIGAFRAFRTDLRKAFENYRNPNVLVDVLLSWGTGRFAVVHVDQEPRHQGKSNYTFSKLAKAAMLILTGFSTAPLRFTSLIGFSFTLFGICVLIYVLGVYFFQGSIPGFPFLASLIAMFSGAQLFALGIIGEYLARVFDYSMQRPAYTIAEVTQSADPSVEQPAQPGNGTHAA